MSTDCSLSSGRAPWHPVPAFVAPTPEIVSAVQEMWQAVDTQVAECGAGCRACGSCCDFPRSGHVLFATALELSVLTSWAAEHCRLDRNDVFASLSAGLCPFWRRGRCEARPARPLGCRVYFCDTCASQILHEICEQGLRKLDVLNARFGRLRWYGSALEYFLYNTAHLFFLAQTDKDDVST